MHTVYLIGNGFDLTMGLKTRYQDFYDYLTKKYQTCSKPLQGLLEEVRLDKDLTFWSDLERAFGMYTSKLKTVDELKVLYEDLNCHFNEYLLKIEAGFNPNIKMKYKFISDMIYPSKYLNENEKQAFKVFLKHYKNDFLFRKSIITFNYTRTIEKLINDKVPVRQAALNIRSLGKTQIIHLHGELDKGIVIGVNDIEQIDNENFRNNEFARDLLIKEQSNQCMGYSRHRDCENLIKKANVIIIFGLSLGITDKRWWQLIGQQLVGRKNICIIYFFKTKNNLNLKQYLAEEKRREFVYLMKQLGFEDSNTYPKDLNQRLFLVPNAKIVI